jgi:hypothetical protein
MRATKQLQVLRNGTATWAVGFEIEQKMMDAKHHKNSYNSVKTLSTTDWKERFANQVERIPATYVGEVEPDSPHVPVRG